MIVNWNTVQQRLFLRPSSSRKLILIILYLSSAIILAFWYQSPNTEHILSSSLLTFYPPPPPPPSSQPLQLSKPQQNKMLFKKINLFWQSMERTASHLNDHYDTIAQNIAAISARINSPSTCYQQIEDAFRTGVNAEWSTKLIHSNSIVTKNLAQILLAEEFTSLGQFNDCLEVERVKWVKNNATSVVATAFTGKYCLVNITTVQLPWSLLSTSLSTTAELNFELSETCKTFNDSSKATFCSKNSFFKNVLAKRLLTLRNRFPLMLGICVPSTCQEGEVLLLLKKYFEHYLHGLSLDVGYCQHKVGSLAENEKGKIVYSRSPGSDRHFPASADYSFFISALLLSSTVLLCLFATVFQLLFGHAADHQTLQNSKTQTSPFKSPLPPSLLVKLVTAFDLVDSLLNCLLSEKTSPPKHCSKTSNQNVQNNQNLMPEISKNSPNSLTVSPPPPPLDLSFLDGLRGLATMGTVLSHATNNVHFLFLPQAVSPFAGLPSFYQQSTASSGPLGLLFSMQQHHSLSIQAFFLFSGFLNTAAMRQKSNTLTSSFWRFALDRYLSLAPSIGATLCLTIVAFRTGSSLGMLPFFGAPHSGPLLHPDLVEHPRSVWSACTTHWARHLLLVNNFSNINQMCGLHLWFAGALFQLHLLLFPVLFLYHQKKAAKNSRKWAYGLACTLAVGVTPLYLGYLGSKGIGIQNGFFYLNFEQLFPLDSFRFVVTMPFLHTFPFFASVVAALIAVSDNSIGSGARLVHKWFSTASAQFYHRFVFLVLPLPIFTYFLPTSSPFFDPPNGPQNESTSFVVLYALLILFQGVTFAAFLLLTALRVSWSPVKAFLELPFWRPFSRLALAMYLVNGISFWVNGLKVRSSLTLSSDFIKNWTIINVVENVIFAVLLYLFVQAPCQKLKRYFL